MTQVFPTVIFWLMVFLFSGELIFNLLKKERPAQSCRTLETWTSLAGLLFIAFTVRRPPLFGSFEAGCYIIFTLILLAKVSREPVFLMNSIVVLFILGIQIGTPMVINDDYYMYDNIWVILFFNLRLLSAAFFVHVMVLYLSCLFRRSEESVPSLLKYARNPLLFGAVIYLSSEWSGSLWCLNWFGDAWRWSDGFLKASMLFLMVMTVSHLPQVLGRNKLLRTILGSLPGSFALWMIFFH